MPVACPKCGSSARTFVRPGLWRCGGGWTEPGGHVPGGYGGGPGLPNPFAGPGVIYHQPRYRPDVFHACKHEYDVSDYELTRDEEQPYSNTLSALCEVDEALPVLHRLPAPTRPEHVAPDPFWFFGLIPWWLGGTLAIWLFVTNPAHAQDALALAAEIAGVLCIFVFAAWMTRAAVLRGRFSKQQRAYDRAIRAAEERDLARSRMLESFK